MMQLPAYNTGNALLDFSPREPGLATYRKGMDENQNYLTSQKVAENVRNKDWSGAMGNALMGNRADLANLAMQAQSHASQQEDAAFSRTMRMAQVHGAAADRALKSNDPAQQQAAWQQMLRSHPVCREPAKIRR